MTARFILCRLALAGFAGLIVTSEGLAETRLMSDPDGVVLRAAPADESATAPFSTPNTVQGPANVAPPVAGDPAGAASTIVPPAAKAASPDSGQSPALSKSATDPSASADVPAPSWLSRAKRFVAGLVLQSGK